MKKTPIIIVSIFVFLAVILFSIQYFWKNRHEYFFKGEQPFELREENIREKEQRKYDSWGNDQENHSETSKVEGNDGEEIERPEKKYETPKIEKTDCDDDCTDYEDDDLLYCQEICGFSEPSNLSDQGQGNIDNEGDENKDGDDECIEKKGLEKDSCYKWKAIREKNPNFCNKISDEDLGESCQNRVIEELFQ